MVKIEISGLRLNDEQKKAVKKFAFKIDEVLYELLFITKLANGQVEFYLYQKGAKRFDYASFKKFDSKDFMLGYIAAMNEYVHGPIFTL